MTSWTSWCRSHTTSVPVSWWVSQERAKRRTLSTLFVPHRPRQQLRQHVSSPPIYPRAKRLTSLHHLHHHPAQHLRIKQQAREKHRQIQRMQRRQTRKIEPLLLLPHVAPRLRRKRPPPRMPPLLPLSNPLQQPPQRRINHVHLEMRLDALDPPDHRANEAPYASHGCFPHSGFGGVDTAFARAGETASETLGVGEGGPAARIC